MKAVLEFNLPEDHAEFHVATHAMDWKILADEYDEDLRLKLKHGELTEEFAKGVQWARDEFHRHLSDRNLVLHEDG